MLERVRLQFAIDELVVEARDNAVYPKVKEQFGDAVRALSDAEQDSKELKSAKRHALVEQISRTANLPFPSRTEPDDHGNTQLDAPARAAVGACVDKLYKEIVRAKIAETARPYPTARVWAPWNLSMADNSCLGEAVDCYSVAPIRSK